ncbi:MAG: hypothetical protein ACJ704_04330 [Nitrososphaeraceae archaeon]
MQVPPLSIGARPLSKARTIVETIAIIGTTEVAILFHEKQTQIMMIILRIMIIIIKQTVGSTACCRR